jgi:DNA-binding CsgD family transcriptional regulator/sugar-specific transcriptional regulator TrmB
LVVDPDTTIDDLATKQNASFDQVKNGLDELLDGRLIRGAPTPSGVVAIDPALAVEAHIARAERDLAKELAELAEVRMQLAAVSKDYATGHVREGARPGLEIVVGTEEIHRHILLAAERETTESRHLTNRLSGDALRRSAPIDIEALSRGVQLRSIVAAPLLDDPDLYRVLEVNSRRGELIRTLPAVPTQMMISDRDLAILAVDPFDSSMGAVLIRAPSLVETLIYLFDRLWSDGDPVFADAADASAPTGRSARVLELMAIGVKDERIARSLGVGVRTVRREVADLKTILGVHSRAEIVAAAVRKDWL